MSSLTGLRARAIQLCVCVFVCDIDAKRSIHPQTLLNTVSSTVFELWVLSMLGTFVYIYIYCICVSVCFFLGWVTQSMVMLCVCGWLLNSLKRKPSTGNDYYKSDMYFA